MRYCARRVRRVHEPKVVFVRESADAMGHRLAVSVSICMVFVAGMIPSGRCGVWNGVSW